MKKRKLTKKERKAHRATERAARGVRTGWARSEASFWRDEFGLDVDRIGPALVEKVRARDVESRARGLERSIAAWPDFGFWECSECGRLDAWPGDRDQRFSTCMGCGAAMTSDDVGDDTADWIERGPVLAVVDDAETERVLTKLLDEWIDGYAAEARSYADDVESDIAWSPADVLDNVQEATLDGLTDDLRAVDWRTIARGLGSWLDEHPRDVDPVDFLEVANALLDDQ